MSRLRMDRAASIYLFHRLSERFHGPVAPRVPILMYHSIREGNSTGHAYYETNTSPRVFALHMNYLRENGYRAVSIDEAIRTLESGGTQSKPVVMTFDDGFRDFYTAAFPVLRENSFSATVFLIAGLTSEERTHFKGNPVLTWKEVKELSAQGIHFGSHTLSHPKLEEMKPGEVDEEIGRSKEIIEDKIGSPVTSFSYPYAFPETRKQFVRMLRQSLERHGYQNGVSTVIGTARSQDDPFFLPRLPVNSWDDLPLFRAKLEGGYDWLHTLQRGSKLITTGMAR